LKEKLKERIILGIDPGTNITGYGVIKTVGVVAELITIGSIDLSRYKDHYIKLKYIFTAKLVL
jgi:crossover junction endodeoxyribonuclease RuvC